MVDTRPDVAIFWDFESCPATPTSSGYTIVDNIRSLALRFGVIKSFRSYLAVADQQYASAGPGGHPRALALRSELQSSGVSLTDVPYGKDGIGKTLLVDLLACAFDHLPTGIVLVVITADHLLAYALSVLRMRNYQVVLLTSQTVASSALISQAAVCFSWNGSEAESHFAPPPASPRTPLKGKDTARSSEERAGRPTADYAAAASQSGPYTASTSGVASPDITQGKDVDLKDYLPERSPLQDLGKNLDKPTRNSEGLDAPEGEDIIILSVPDSSDEEDLGVRISLSEAGQEEECFIHENERSQTAFTQSILDSGGAGSGGMIAEDDHGDGANSNPIKSEASSPEATTRLNLSLPKTLHASDLPSEQPPAYTAHQQHGSFHFMQPSELNGSTPSSSTTLGSPSNFPDPSVCDSPPVRPFSTHSSDGQGFLSSTSGTRLGVTEPTPATPAVSISPSQISSPTPSPSNSSLPTDDSPASSTPGPSKAGPTPAASTPSLGGSVPEHYKVLVEVMEDYRKQGVTSVRRAFLGEQLPKRQPNVYARAALDGTAKPLKNYVDNAIDAGILMRESEEYVSLAKAYIPQAAEPKHTPSDPDPTSPPASGSTRPAVPPHFKLLVDLMEELREKGFSTPSRGYLGFILPQRQSNVYALAGCYASGKIPASRKYIDAAIEAGLLKQESNGTHVSLVPRPVVPGQFASLVLVMKQQHTRGLKWVNRTMLSNELLRAQPDVYVQAGFGNISKPMLHYLDSAVEAEILVEWEDSTYSLNDAYR